MRAVWPERLPLTMRLGSDDLNPAGLQFEDAIAAVVRVDTPIAFDAPDGQPVSLLVFLLVPEHATEEHLEILSELAELLSDTGIRDTLMTSSDASGIHRVLATWEPYRPAA